MDTGAEMTHKMILMSDHEGTEEWYCPACGRCLLIEWEPFQQVLLYSGDENAGHAGSEGGLSIGSVEVESK